MSKGTRRGWIKALVGMAISVACIAFIASRIDSAALANALAAFHWWYLPIALSALAVDYALRVVRWAMMLRATGANVTAVRCAPAFLGSMAINNLLPLRAGDVVRALVFPVSLGVRRSIATASLVLERLVDLLTLLACLGLGILLVPSLPLLEWQREALALLSLGGAVALVAVIVLAAPLAAIARRAERAFLEKSRVRASTLVEQVALLFDGLSGMSRPSTLAMLGALSVIIWCGEAALFLALMHGFGIAASAPEALAVMAITTLATLVPSSPGYVGPFHLAAFAAASLLGASEAQAAGFALVTHLALWVPVTLAGIIGILLQPQLFSRLRQSTDTNIE